MAAATFPGMPSANNGINEDATAPLLEDSAEVIPFGFPFPYESLFFDVFFEKIYETQEAVTDPKPGIIPITIPVIEPIDIGLACPFKSLLLSLTFIFSLFTS